MNDTVIKDDVFKQFPISVGLYVVGDDTETVKVNLFFLTLLLVKSEKKTPPLSILIREH